VSILAVLAAHGRHRQLNRHQLISRLDAETREATRMAAELDTLRGLRRELGQQIDDAGRQLDAAREDHADTVARIEAQHAAVVAAMQQQIDDLTRRLQVGVLAEAAASKTQEIDVREAQARFAEGPVVSLHHSPQGVDLPQQRRVS
jgi:phage host-nuclease inhibitor protein Gam